MSGIRAFLLRVLAERRSKIITSHYDCVLAELVAMRFTGSYTVDSHLGKPKKIRIHDDAEIVLE